MTTSLAQTLPETRADGLGSGPAEERAAHLLATAATKLAAIPTYACTVLCQERLAGKLRRQERIESVFQAPHSVYLRWLPGSPFEGLQASHVPGRDGPDRFMARETGLKGLAGAIRLHHRSKLVDQLYPHHFRTHETSLHHLVRLSVELVARAKARGTLRVPRIEGVDDALLRAKATRVDCELTSAPAEGLGWPRAELFFEERSGLPLHLRLHDFDGGLFGEYAFVDFAPNVSVGRSTFELRRL